MRAKGILMGIAGCGRGVRSFWNWVILEAVFIHIEPQVVNRDKRLNLENVWLPILLLLSHEMKQVWDGTKWWLSKP